MTWIGKAAGTSLRARGFDWGLIPCLRCRGAFAGGYLDRLAEQIQGSPYLSETNLNYRFAGTRGFAVVFREDGMDRLRRNFPVLNAYLDAVLDPRCNAFFLNPLVMSGTSRIAPHVDRSLRSLTMPDEPPNPQRVSVLYAQVPAGMRGGALVLYHRLLPLARLRPERGLLVDFQGFLRHEVTTVRAAEGGMPRVSLVCEQYALRDDLLRRIPAFTVRSSAAFEAFMAADLERPVSAFAPMRKAQLQRGELPVGEEGDAPSTSPPSKE